jgi:hypothetical protein
MKPITTSYEFPITPNLAAKAAEGEAVEETFTVHEKNHGGNGSHWHREDMFIN